MLRPTLCGALLALGLHATAHAQAPAAAPAAPATHETTPAGPTAAHDATPAASATATHPAAAPSDASHQLGAPRVAPARTPAGEPPCPEPEPVFDPSTPRLELQVGGGYAGFFSTFRQSSDGLMAPGAHPDGAYFGPLFRGELAFALGGLSLSAIYTHISSEHDGSAHPLDWSLVSGELGVQCACRGSFYVWSFGLEVGWNLASPALFASIEHRSLFYVWEELFLGFDVDLATFVGLTFGGPSGGGALGSVFIGYSLD